MTSPTPRRPRRLAFMAAGAAVAMLLVPGTALAEETTPTPGIDVVKTLQGLTNVVGAQDAPAVPAVPGAPGGLPAVPALPSLPIGSPGTSGHELQAPKAPDHGSGYVGDLDLGDKDLLDLVEYKAAINDDGSSKSDATVLGLLGNELFGANGGSSSDGTTKTSDNLTKDLCPATNGVLCLGLLYEDTMAVVDNEGSLAGARGGVLSLCLLGDDPDVTTSYECKGQIGGVGAAEGEAAAERDGVTGHTTDYSDNELLKACLVGGKGWESFHCEDLLGVSVLHADSDSESVTPSTAHGSWLVGLDLGQLGADAQGPG